VVETESTAETGAAAPEVSVVVAVGFVVVSAVMGELALVVHVECSGLLIAEDGLEVGALAALWLVLTMEAFLSLSVVLMAVQFAAVTWDAVLQDLQPLLALLLGA
jgi:hypothetical protein